MTHKMFGPYKSVEEMMKDMKSHYTWWDKIILHPSMNWLRWIIYALPDMPRDFYRKCKRGYQRAYRGWADEDVWCLDFYLAKVIKDSIKKLQKDTNGYPGNLTAEQWNSILEDIIYTFETCERRLDFPIIHIDKERYKRGWEHFQNHFNELWD